MKAFLRGRCERKVETYNRPCENLSGRKHLPTACRRRRSKKTTGKGTGYLQTVFFLSESLSKI